MTKLYAFDIQTWVHREISESNLVHESMTGDLVVQVREKAGRLFTIEALDWYDNTGECQLTVNAVTLDVALKMFAAAAKVAAEAEANGEIVAA